MDIHRTYCRILCSATRNNLGTAFRSSIKDLPLITPPHIQEVEAGRLQIDRIPTAMWPLVSTEGQQGGSRKRPSFAASTMAKLSELALHSASNINHKHQLALFVPASFISLLATNAGVFDPTVWHKPASELGA